MTNVLNNTQEVIYSNADCVDRRGENNSDIPQGSNSTTDCYIDSEDIEQQKETIRDRVERSRKEFKEFIRTRREKDKRFELVKTVLVISVTGLVVTIANISVFLLAQYV